MVRLYEGCWGKRRDGKIVGPFRFRGEDDFPFEDADGCTYTVKGDYYHHGKVTQYDILEAYPHDPRVKTQEPPPFNLTTREQWRWWFAGQAMNGILSSNANDWVDTKGKKVSLNSTNIAELSVQYADKSIQQLEKGKEDE